jgi:hypothetical protein
VRSKWLYTFVISTVLAAPVAGLANDASLVGTWKLTSFVREVTATGERYNQLGEHPEGYLGYAVDGRMYAILVAGERVKPHEQAPTDEEALKLYRSMIAYTGSYTIDGDKVTSISPGMAHGPGAQGDTLTIKTEPNKSPIDGGEGVGILVWQKVK